MTKPKDETVESPKPAIEAEPPAPQDDIATPPKEDDDDITPAMQAIIDRRIQRQLKRAKEEQAQELATEKARLAKEAREAQLLEKENFKELYEARETELAGLKAERQRADMDAKTDVLLDNAGVTLPALRALVKALPADLEARAERITELATLIDDETEARVSKRLHTDAPDKRRAAPGTKRLADMTYSEKAALREKIGDVAFVERVQAEKSAVS